MNSKNFKTQILEFNKFLKTNKNNINLISLSFLHILRPQYDLIKNFSNFDLKYRITYHFRFTLKKILKNFFTKKKLKNYLPEKVDLLILSNLINLSDLNKKEDFYFGYLQSDLNKIGINCHTIFRNFTINTANEIRKKNINRHNHFIDDFDEKRLEIKYFFLSLIEFFKFKINITNTDEIKKYKNSFSFYNFLTGISSQRLSSLIIKFIKEKNPKIIFFTLEGHSWEKILTYKLKKQFPNLIIIGYQFSVISRNTNSLFLKLGKNYEPDFIFTKNKVHKKIFEKKGFNSNKIKILGNLKYKKIKLDTKNKLDNIIICPEALDYENEVMFDFAQKCAAEIKNHNFTFRPHPNFKKKISSKYKNLFISKKSLHNDLSKAKILIYRGSSVCFDTASYKILPLYLKIKDEISLDPLYMFQKNNFQILNVSDLKKIIYNFSKDSKKINMFLKKITQFNLKPKISIFKKILNDK